MLSRCNNGQHFYCLLCLCCVLQHQTHATFNALMQSKHGDFRSVNKIIFTTELLFLSSYALQTIRWQKTLGCSPMTMGSDMYQF